MSTVDDNHQFLPYKHSYITLAIDREPGSTNTNSQTREVSLIVKSKKHTTDEPTQQI